MATIITLKPGTDVTSADLNTNFSNLNTAITSNSTNISSLTSSVNTLNSTVAGITTPSSSFKATLLGLLYPINSIYLTIDTSDTCPIQTQLGGTWELVSTDRVLQGASTVAGAGGTKAAGLPNIYGGFAVTGMGNNLASWDAFYNDGWRAGDGDGDGGINGGQFGFNAARCSSIYGSSSTVQPPAYLVNVWKRTA